MLKNQRLYKFFVYNNLEYLATSRVLNFDFNDKQNCNILKIKYQIMTSKSLIKLVG